MCQSHFSMRNQLPTCSELPSQDLLSCLSRDLKPSNVLFETVGGAAAPDWGDCGRGHPHREDQRPVGLSRHLSRHLVEEQTMSVVGSRAYWAPEVETGRYDELADIYSIGIVLYELLMGTRPKKQVEGRLKKKLNYPPPTPTPKSIFFWQ